MGAYTRLKEAISVAFKGLESHIIANQGAPELDWQFTRLSGPGGIQRIRNLPEQTQEEMLKRAHAVYQGNPLGNRGIDITAEYVIGDGIQFTALSDGVQQVLNEHWDDPTNNWSLNQMQRTIELGLSGEECIPVSVNPENGHTTLGYIDPVLIDQIVMDPKNAMKAHAVLIKRSPVSEVRRAYKIIEVPNVSKDSPVFGKLVGLADDEKQKEEWGVEFAIGDRSLLKFPGATGLQTTLVEWVGSCFFFKVNSPLGATRGWSDLLAGLDWIDQHDQLLFSLTEKATNAGKYVVDVLLKGMNEEQQRKWLAKRRSSFMPGEWVTHNEDVEYSFPAPDLKLEDQTILTSTLKNHVLASYGHPPLWYAEAGNARASAPEMTEPSFKHLRARQRIIAYMISQVFKFAINQAELHDTLVKDGRVGIGTQVDLQSKSFYLRMVDVSAKDQRMLSIAVRNISSALKQAVEFGFDEEEASRVFGRYLELLGLDTWRQEPTSTTVHSDPDQITKNVFKAVASETVNPREFSSQESTYYVYATHEERIAIREAVQEAEQIVSKGQTNKVSSGLKND